MNANFFSQIINKCIIEFHKNIDFNAPFSNIYPEGTIEALIYNKAWIDNVQWHMEDLIRDPHISLEYLARLKSGIDRQNQKRTNVVEVIDDWFFDYLKGYKRNKDSRMNSESPAWILDRISILLLKIYHMEEQSERLDVNDSHRDRATEKLRILLEQHRDLSRCFDELIEDIKEGKRYTKVYRQMKMYNDISFNPVLSRTKNCKLGT